MAFTLMLTGARCARRKHSLLILRSLRKNNRLSPQKGRNKATTLIENYSCFRIRNDIAFLKSRKNSP
jgi:hypothetical protein